MTSAIFSLPLWSNSKLYAEDYRDKGEPFIDTFDEGGKVVIRLGNRRNDVEIQKRILASIGWTEDKIRKDGRTDYAIFEKDTSDIVIMTKVAELMKNLSA